MDQQRGHDVQNEVGADVGEHGGQQAAALLGYNQPKMTPPIPLSSSARVTTSGVKGSMAPLSGGDPRQRAAL